MRDGKEQEEGEAQGAFGSRDVQLLGSSRPLLLLPPAPSSSRWRQLLILFAPPHNQSPPSSRAHSFFGSLAQSS